MWNPADLLWNFGLLGVNAVDNNSSCQACPKGTFANNSEYSLLHVLLVNIIHWDTILFGISKRALSFLLKQEVAAV